MLDFSSTFEHVHDLGCGMPIMSRSWRFDRPLTACRPKARGFRPPMTVGENISFNRVNAAFSALPHRRRYSMTSSLKKQASLRDPGPRKFPRLSQHYNTVPAIDFHGPADSIAPPVHHLAVNILRRAKTTQIAEPQATLKNVLSFRLMEAYGFGPVCGCYFVPQREPSLKKTGDHNTTSHDPGFRDARGGALLNLR